jgi:hypothetical protein
MSMLRSKLQAASAIAVAFALFAPASANADGLALPSAKLRPEARAAIRADVAVVAKARPDLVARVRNVRGVTPEVYKQERNPKPNADRELRALGREALAPMLEALAIDATQPGLAPHEREALTVGMLAAVGHWRDARSLPALRAIVAEHTGSSTIAVAAAEALGQACEEADRALLASKTVLVPGSVDARLAGVVGLGACRREGSVAPVAVVALAADVDARLRAEAIEALGNLGASWTWSALAADARRTGGDAAAVEARARTIRAAVEAPLLDAFAKHPAQRDAAARALAKLESTTAGAEAVRRADAARAVGDAELAAAFDGLARRLTPRRGR